MTDPRSVSDAAHLTLETDASLRAMVDAPVGEVSETTRVLARLELEARGMREPTDDEIYNRPGVEGGIAYSLDDDRPGSLGENDWRL